MDAPDVRGYALHRWCVGSWIGWKRGPPRAPTGCTAAMVAAPHANCGGRARRRVCAHACTNAWAGCLVSVPTRLEIHGTRAAAAAPAQAPDSRPHHLHQQHWPPARGGRAAAPLSRNVRALLDVVGVYLCCPFRVSARPSATSRGRRGRRQRAQQPAPAAKTTPKTRGGLSRRPLSRQTLGSFSLMQAWWKVGAGRPWGRAIYARSEDARTEGVVGGGVMIL